MCHQLMVFLVLNPLGMPRLVPLFVCLLNAHLVSFDLALQVFAPDDSFHHLSL